MRCLAMLLDGSDRKAAAEACGMDRQSLRDWLDRYNAQGLRDPPPKLTKFLFQDFLFQDEARIGQHGRV
jgi:hypothetical protein